MRNMRILVDSEIQTKWHMLILGQEKRKVCKSPLAQRRYINLMVGQGKTDRVLSGGDNFPWGKSSYIESKCIAGELIGKRNA